MNLRELEQKMRRVLHRATLDYDKDGQIIVCTNLTPATPTTLDNDNPELVDFELYDEYDDQDDFYWDHNSDNDDVEPVE
jgi:hypothetical protein